MTEVGGIAAALAAISPAGIGWAAVAIQRQHPPLWPGEWAAVASALPVRRREFIAGRAAARSAMAQAGLLPHALPARPDRCPEWPRGVVGSIAHDQQFAVSAVGRRDEWRGIGLDIERAGAVEEALAEAILRDEERAAADDLTTVFCAKEAVQKAVFPATGTLLEFHDVVVRAKAPLRYEAVLLRASGALPPGAAFTVRCDVAGDHILAAVFWR